MSKAIEFDGVGKMYQLGRVGTGTLSHDLNRWWMTKVLGKEDPYLRIGQVNDRTVRGEEDDIVWALQDISFGVEQGEVLGIIGSNGAGKSTLLKLLSRITAPSVGSIRYNGRIGSLLEVGTGFHGEMTGRENIYMNGAILGMRRAEISAKLDEIVDFAGVARYLDTPVKRYSSGMMVRLGFAVAAFLEPEILVMDEVLAVGDAEFQKKAIGKMQDVSKGEGRTVLFVSHNMESVKALCTRGIVLKNGMMDFDGTALEAVEHYLAGKVGELRREVTASPEVQIRRPDGMQILSARLCNDPACIATRETISYELEVRRLAPSISRFNVYTLVLNTRDQSLWSAPSTYVELPPDGKEFRLRVDIPGHNTPCGRYQLWTFVADYGYTRARVYHGINAFVFDVPFVDVEHTVPFTCWVRKDTCSVTGATANLIGDE